MTGLLGFANLHILTIKHGEVYVHHFWLLFFLAMAIFGAAKSTCSHRGAK